MKIICGAFWSFFFLLFISHMVYSQKRDSSYVGSVKGQLKDSLHNYALQTATVTIYKIKNDEIISYQLTNNFGRFDFKQLPTGIPLKLVASYIGYGTVNKKFILPGHLKDLDFNIIYMNSLNLKLDAVTITASPPPIQMRGDTLEFNAAAFKLDTNAVVEDLLRKMPGVTIWSDGLITVNGKKINRLFVEGKEFFGGGSKVALQNLPKNAVQKIQVYQNNENQDPSDPKTDMNIVLKKNKREGYFGKLSGGYGNKKRYDGVGMLAFYSPQTQISVVGAINNVNKVAYSVEELISLNSFKGENIDNQYYSDFRRQGTNVFKSLGGTIFHDFVSKQNSAKNDTNLLKVDLISQNITTDIRNNLMTIITLPNSEILNQVSTRTEQNRSFGETANSSYKRSFPHSRIDFYANYKGNKSENFNRSETSSVNLANNANSTNVSEQFNKSDQQIYNGHLSFVTHSYMDYKTNKLKNFDSNTEYNLIADILDSERNRISSFITNDINQNRFFNRKYKVENTDVSHIIKNSIYNFTNLLNIKPIYFQTDLKNTLTFINSRNNNLVNDIDENSGEINLNPLLTNQSNESVFKYSPGILFYKIFMRELTNRYKKAWKIDVFPRMELYSQLNKSQKQFQNISRSSITFLPTASFVYSHFKTGGSRRAYLFNYNTSINYPSIFQLAPLVDDANVLNVFYGNPELKPSYEHKVSISYNYDNGGGKNPFSTNINFVAGIIKNYVSDSLIIDEFGRNLHFPINVSGFKYSSVNASLRKAYKVNEHQFQIDGKGGISYSNIPSILNGSKFDANSRGCNLSFQILYNYKNLVTIDFGESFITNSNSGRNLKTFNYTNWRTYTNIIISSPKGIFFGSRADLNNNKSSIAEKFHYFIWNADCGYRFLKGANAEVKFSALDILHQNKNIYNSISNNSVTSGTVNVLQQYFLLTVSYYPRKFGLRK